MLVGARQVAAGCLGLLLVAVPLAEGQSLAEIAAKEQARREKIQKPSPVYTNKDLEPSSRPAPPPPAADAGTPTAPEADEEAVTEEGAPPAEGEAPEEEEDLAKQEEMWRSRITEARAALERSQMFAEALQSRINALWADFTARDDPAQRAVIEAERRKAIAQLDRVKAEIVAQTKAIADIEEEARRAGVPPGWLR